MTHARGVQTPNLTTLAALLLALTLTSSCLSPRIEARLDDNAALVEAVNRVRGEHRLRVLEQRADLARIALAHAEDMAHRSYLSHVTPEGLNPLHRAQSAGLDGFRLLAENIGVTSVRGDRRAAVIEEWLRSPDHRRNLLHPAFNATGVGITESPRGETLYVQLFATY